MWWGHVWKGGVHGGGHMWQGACVAGGMHGRGACVVGGMHGRGGGGCMAGKMATAAGSTHPTGMHSFFKGNH